MFSADQYALLDFGNGRKLERFAGVQLDRPSPAAEGVAPHAPQQWDADVRFVRDHDEGTWQPPTRDNWLVRWNTIRLELKLTPFGHLGVFPEQAENWHWIDKQTRRANAPLHVLNLFAHTGGSTLAAAAAGAHVVHVDAARNVIQWARRNARLSGLESSPIRWICEDAEKFVRRELRRGNQYDAVILDPPSFGRGPKGEVWKLDRQLPVLVDSCFKLLRDSARFLLLSCHAIDWNRHALARLLEDAGQGHAGRVLADDFRLEAKGRRLPCGVFARWVPE